MTPRWIATLIGLGCLGFAAQAQAPAAAPAGGASSGQICMGAEAASKACCAPCSNCNVNDGPNSGFLNVGYNNLGQGNDGFNNIGDFNIGPGNVGDCNLGSGLKGNGIKSGVSGTGSGSDGSCPAETHRMIVNFCTIRPTYSKCQNPPAYFGATLTAKVRAAVARCNSTAAGA